MTEAHTLPNGLTVNAAGWIDTSTVEWQKVCFRLNRENLARIRAQRGNPPERWERSAFGHIPATPARIRRRG